MASGMAGADNPDDPCRVWILLPVRAGSMGRTLKAAKVCVNGEIPDVLVDDPAASVVAGGGAPARMRDNAGVWVRILLPRLFIAVLMLFRLSLAKLLTIAEGRLNVAFVFARAALKVNVGANAAGDGGTPITLFRTE